MRNTIKRALSLILAMCIVATFIPAAFADTTEPVPGTLVYSFMQSTYGESVTSAEAISYDIGNKNMAYFASENTSDGTTNDFAVWDGTTNKSVKLRMYWWDRNSSHYNYAAFKINGIELKEYKVTLQHAVHKEGNTKVDMYILDAATTAKVISGEMTMKAAINAVKKSPVLDNIDMNKGLTAAPYYNTTTEKFTYTPDAAGEHLLVFTLDETGGNQKYHAFPQVLTLEPVVQVAAPRKYTFGTNEAIITTAGQPASKVNDFGTWGWKYLDIDDASYDIAFNKGANGKNNERVMQMQASDLRMNLTHSDPSYSVESIKLALALERPVASFYKVDVEASGRGNVCFYLSKFISDATPVEEHMATAMAFNKLNLDISAGSPETRTLDKLVYSNGVDNLVFAINAESTKYLNSLTLTPVEANTELNVDDTELLVGETATATLVASFTDNDVPKSMNVLNTFVDYESLNSSVASIDANGKITALAEGDTTITATVDGVEIYNQLISVTAPAEPEDEPELTNAFAHESTRTVQVSNNVTVNTYVYTVDGTKKELDATTTVPVGTAYEVNADEITGMDEYKFLYWAKGATMDKKQIASGNAKYSFVPTVEATHLIAVFAPKNEAGEAKAEFYNGNGQLLPDYTVESGETVTIPALPSMAGYGDATHWALYGDATEYKEGDSVALSGTMIFVAQYDDLTADITVNVTGGSCNQTEYKYGDVVTCRPEIEENFMCWKKDGVIVSMNTEYKFNAWEDCDVEAVYKAEYTFNGKATKLLIDIFNDKFIMAEFIGLSNYGTVVEKGIMIGNKCFAMQKPLATQFTLEAKDATEAATAVAYAIFKDGTMITDK